MDDGKLMMASVISRGRVSMSVGSLSKGLCAWATRGSGMILLLLLYVHFLEAQVVPGRYVVELAGEPVVSYAKRAGGAEERRAQIRAEHQQVRLELERRGAEVLERVDTVANALIVSMPDERAALLAQTPGVVRVRPVHEVRPLLDHALPLHKVPEAWAQIGGTDRAGAGIKIGIIDTGIDHQHAGFQDDSLPALDGFPRVNRDSDLALTNRKIIVARNYGQLLSRRDDLDARDHEGHGTAVAMAAAGVQSSGPRGTITGVAPKAYLGNYKITAGGGASSRDDVILKALDDAVADGMDVVNISFGRALAGKPSDDLLNGAIETASSIGVIVATPAGNSGPEPNTLHSPGTAGSAITVGASWNSRVFFSSATVEGLAPFLAIPGIGPVPDDPVRAPMVDVARLDENGMACLRLPAESLTGRIAFILRGVCLFETKLNNAQRAGAVAALLYTDAERPDPVIMNVGNATLPALMVSYADGVQIKGRVAGVPSVPATLDFSDGPVPVNPNRVAAFSSRGPNLDGTIKPDLLAVGLALYTATQSFDNASEYYDVTGYIDVYGTSFSAPLVAGAAAVLKSARPGLSSQQYRSLLVNSATPLPPDATPLLPVQRAGAGLLNLAAALQSTVAAVPVSISFGVGSAAPDLSKEVTISNVGTAAETFAISVLPRDDRPAPSLSTNTVELAAGASGNVIVRFSATDLPAGEYQGFVRIQGSRSAVEARIPYWYAVPSDTPRFLTILTAREFGDAGPTLNRAIVVRVTDAAGIVVSSVVPKVTVISGGGTVVNVVSLDPDVPGAYGVDLQLGLGDNVFRIEAGDLAIEITIRGESAPRP